MFTVIGDSPPPESRDLRTRQTLARPAYQKLLAAEPFLRRLIPIFIVIFLMIVGAARFVQLYQHKTERDYDARETIGLIATALSAALDKTHSADGSASCLG